MRKSLLTALFAFLFLFCQKDVAAIEENITLDSLKNGELNQATNDSATDNTNALNTNSSPEENATQINNPEETTVLYGSTKKKQIFALGNVFESEKSSSVNMDVITLDEITELGSPMIQKLLNTLGSVTVQTSGSTGDISSFRIRGTDRVRVTVDGIRADSPVDNKFYVTNYLSDDIERVEVIKGPQGNVSGVNALGGLVAMQTRQGRGPTRLELDSKMGSLGSFKERAAIMGGNEKGDFYLSATWFKTDGGLRINDNLERVKNDGYNTFNTVGNVAARFMDGKVELRETFRLSNSRKNVGINGFGDYIQQDYNDYSTNLDLFNNIALNIKPNEWYDSSTKFGIFNTVNNFYQRPDDYDTSAGSDKFKSTRVSLISQHNFKYKDINTLSLGYSLESNYFKSISDYSSDPFWPSLNEFNGNTMQNDFFVNDMINIKDRLFIRGGARIINHSTFGTYVTPNGSIALVLPTFKMDNDYTKFRASWGHSINTPTLYQMYGKLTGMMDPNKNLTPEKLSSWDVGVRQTFFNEKLQLDFGYFNSTYQDYIGWVSDPITWIGKYKNIASADINGYEGSVSWIPNKKFRASINYTYTNSLDNDTGYELPAVPKNRINGTLVFTPCERFSMYAGVENASSRIYSGNDRVDGYTDVSMGANIRLFSIKKVHVYLSAQIYNLLNQKISMYKNYYQPGIHYMAGIFIRVGDKEELL